MNEVNDFGQRLPNFLGYATQCLESACTHDSVVTVILANAVSNPVDVNGLTEEDIRATVRYFLSNRITWWFDKGFSATNQKSRLTRSRFTGGAPESSEWLLTLSDEMLLPANGRYAHTIVSWRKHSLYEHEVLQTLLHDGSLSLGSFGLVAFLVMLQVRSVGHTAAGILGILMGFSTTYYFYYVVAGWETMTLLNFVSLFSIMGFGADDILLLCHTFHNAAHDLGECTATEKMSWSGKQRQRCSQRRSRRVGPSIPSFSPM